MSHELRAASIGPAALGEILGALRVLLADFFAGPASATQRSGRDARSFLAGVVTGSNAYAETTAWSVFSKKRGLNR
jgi:hypothetical protein